MKFKTISQAEKTYIKSPQIQKQNKQQDVLGSPMDPTERFQFP